MSSEHPFFLPKGSIRALLALTLVIGSIACVMARIPNAEVIYALASMAVTHYFNARGNMNGPGNG